MARAVSCGAGARLAFIYLPPVPAALLPVVLLLQPLSERLEVVEDRGRVHLARACELFERVGPRLARALLEHRAVPAAGLGAAEDRALVERPLEAGGIAQ